MKRSTAAIIGGGLCGNLLAICLARRGFSVEVYERRSHAQFMTPAGGRSINLALAARGISALQRFDAFAGIESLLLPMRGRMLHEADAAPVSAPYGASGECIFSVSRAALNLALHDIASQQYGVKFTFEAHCTRMHAQTLDPVFSHAGSEFAAEADVFFAADGAGSTVRRALAQANRLTSAESLLDHAYKELSIAPDPGTGTHRLHGESLHIWPRGEFMLIALPNTDGSFTATLFLPQHGEPSFESLSADGVANFFATQFPDAVELIPDLTEQFARNEVGVLGTVRCKPWHAGRCLLIGDAAHAIVPFHGQGMNAAFEDVAELDVLLARDGTPDWPTLFAEFEQRRTSNTDAIAEMALENYQEMRSDVRDPDFALRRTVALELERRHPGKFASRYSMVMFRPDVPYSQARSIAVAQDAMLRKLTRDVSSVAEVDFRRAAQLVAELPQPDQPSEH